MKKRLLLFLSICLIVIMFALCGCSAKGDFIAMNTEIELSFSGGRTASAYKQAKLRIEEIESNLSVNIDTSYISKINAAEAGKEVSVSAEVFALLKKADELYDLSGGAYNPYIYPLVKLWGFGDGFSNTGSVPSEQDIAAAKVLCVSDSFEFNENNFTVTKKISGAMLDLGGIAKGYTADEVKKIAEQNGVKKAIINIGRNLQLIGGSYKIGISHPREIGKLYGIVTLSNTSAATSGDYERYFMVDGVRYHHIIDSVSGYPAQNGDDDLFSASVFCGDSTVADALSTAFLVKGFDKAQIFYDAIKEKYDNLSVLLIGKKGNKTLGNTEFKRS